MLTLSRSAESKTFAQGTHFCPIKDLSLGGIRIDLHEQLDPGTDVAVIVALDAPGERIMRMGRIAWFRETNGVRPYATGLQFSDAGAARSHVWRDAMIRRFPDAVEPLSELNLPEKRPLANAS